MKIKFPLIFFYFLLFFSVYSQDGFTEKYKTNTDSTLIIITVNVDGKELPFLFDTGTQINVLFDDGTFNLKKAHKITAYDGFNNPTEVHLIRKKIILPYFGIKKKKFCAVMKEKPEVLEKLNIHGILGANIINKYDWKISFETLEISKLNKKYSVSSDAFYTIPTHFERGTLSAYVSVNAEDSVSAIFDTGFNKIMSSNSKNQDYLQKNTTLQSLAYQFTISSSFIDSGFISFDTINVGDIQIENMPVEYSLREIHSSSFGMQFLKSFGEIYMLNSKNKILLRQTDAEQFHFLNYKDRDGIIVTQYFPINSNPEIGLKKRIDEVEMAQEYISVPKTYFLKRKR